jgi:hypothetical protein
MALSDVVFSAIADLTGAAINAIAKRFGKSEVQVKHIERYLFWLVFWAFMSVPIYLTLKYS